MRSRDYTGDVGIVLFILAFLLLALNACGGSRYYDPITPKDECALVHIQNDNWADVAVYLGMGRIATVTGHTEREVDICGARLHQPAEFKVRAIGGAFTLTLRPHSPYVEPGMFFSLVVGASPNLSHIVGD